MADTMSFERGTNSRRRCPTKKDPCSDFMYDKKTGVEVLIPETAVPTIALKIPEMKNETSYWQIGTASLTRVKISCLRPDVKIKTEEACEIGGMFSEGYCEIATLGTVIIHICGKPMKVHVTRSKNTAPIVSDGILGVDYLATQGAFVLPRTTGQDFIPNYLSLLRRRLIESSVSRERGPWSVVSKKLLKVRKFLPPKVASDERLPVIEILEEYADCFHTIGDKLEPTKLLKYKIRTKNNNIVAIPQYKLSPEDRREIDRQVDYLLQQNIIRVSTSPYNSPIRIIEKKPDAHGNVQYRLAPDFHELNKHSEGDAFPIPDIVELIDLLHGSKYFSVLDLASASYQIELDPNDYEKTAFTTDDQRYEYLRMPPGIKNASQNIQRLLNLVIDDMLYSPSMAFVSYDDIIVHSSSIEEHEVRVRKLLARLRDAGLKLQPSKCQLFQKSVSYLGHSITDEGLRPDPAKIEKIRKYKLPESRHCLSSLLGLLSFFKRFVPNYAERAKPMANLLKNDEERLKWTSEARTSFDDVKEAFSRDLLLRYPNWNESFILETSSSDVAIQAALLQKKSADAAALPIAYASRCYTPAEMKYDKLNRERLAAMYGMDTWYWYLGDEKEFILRTPEPRAFDWYVKRASHRSSILGRFEISFSGKNFTIETLRSSK